VYFTAQFLLALGGTLFQCAIRKKKGCTTTEYAVEHETHRAVGLDFEVEVNVEGSGQKFTAPDRDVPYGGGGDSDYEDNN